MRARPRSKSASAAPSPISSKASSAPAMRACRSPPRWISTASAKRSRDASIPKAAWCARPPPRKKPATAPRARGGRRHRRRQCARRRRRRRRPRRRFRRQPAPARKPSITKSPAPRAPKSAKAGACAGSRSRSRSMASPTPGAGRTPRRTYAAAQRRRNAAHHRIGALGGRLQRGARRRGRSRQHAIRARRIAGDGSRQAPGMFDFIGDFDSCASSRSWRC